MKTCTGSQQCQLMRKVQAFHSSMSKQRVFLVSSPLPRTQAEVEFDRTADFVERLRAELSAIWVGWGAVAGTPPHSRCEHAASLDNTRIALELAPRELSVLRDEFLNGILWPILHNRPDLALHQSGTYTSWVELNADLAKSLSELADPEDIIWVHDFPHIPLAVALRQRGFTGRIGMLLHSPFPSLELLTSLPEHKDLLSDLRDFDLVGFQSRNCLDNFHSAAAAILDAKVTDAGLCSPFGDVATGVFQLPGDTNAVAATAGSAKVAKVVSFLRECNAGRRLIASMGTLDPAHGVVAQLRCFAALLEHAPAFRGKASLIQAIPGHSKWLRECPEIRGQVEQTFMHINGQFASVEWTPIQYLHKPLSQTKQIALYRAADVGLFLPFSEGVCLAAKDYVAAQSPDDPGVLVVSRFAGGVEDMTGALIVNPYDEQLVSEALEAALSMPLSERRSRYDSMMQRLGHSDLETWAHEFLTQLLRGKKRLDGSEAA